LLHYVLQGLPWAVALLLFIRRLNYPELNDICSQLCSMLFIKKPSKLSS